MVNYTINRFAVKRHLIGHCKLFLKLVFPLAKAIVSFVLELKSFVAVSVMTGQGGVAYEARYTLNDLTGCISAHSRTWHRLNLLD